MLTAGETVFRRINCGPPWINTGVNNGSRWIPELTLLDDGDFMECGRYHFRCATTPGHTLGHICLYEADRKILIAGDHILDDITSNIQCWTDGQILKWYLNSLDKTAALEVDRVLPGHRRAIPDHRFRIDELKSTMNPSVGSPGNPPTRTPKRFPCCLSDDLGYQMRLLGGIPGDPEMVCHRGGHFSLEIFGGRREDKKRKRRPDHSVAKFLSVEEPTCAKKFPKQ